MSVQTDTAQELPEPVPDGSDRTKRERYGRALESLTRELGDLEAKLPTLVRRERDALTLFLAANPEKKAYQAGSPPAQLRQKRREAEARIGSLELEIAAMRGLWLTEQRQDEDAALDRDVATARALHGRELAATRRIGLAIQAAFEAHREYLDVVDELHVLRHSRPQVRPERRGEWETAVTGVIDPPLGPFGPAMARLVAASTDELGHGVWARGPGVFRIRPDANDALVTALPDLTGSEPRWRRPTKADDLAWLAQHGLTARDAS